jgi:hypothetical protein
MQRLFSGTHTLFDKTAGKIPKKKKTKKKKVAKKPEIQIPEI